MEGPKYVRGVREALEQGRKILLIGAYNQINDGRPLAWGQVAPADGG